MRTRIKAVEPKKKRTRIKEAPIRRRIEKTEIVICSGVTKGSCWFQQGCVHKTPHKHSVACEQTFCSLARIHCCCKKS